MEMTTTIIWAISIVVFVILEAATYQLVSIWFAVGAVGGLIASICGASFTVQMIVFLIISALFLLFLRPVSVKLLKPRGARTNVDSVIGKEAVVTKEIDNLRGTGEAKVDGMMWTARSGDNSVIPKDTAAVIDKVEGVKLIVTRKEY